MTDVLPSASNETSIPESMPLAQWHEAAAAAAASPDLRERVRDLTARALHERRMDLHAFTQVVAAITSGAGSGLATRGGEMKEGLRQAVAGLDDAVGSAAQKMTYTLREAADQGRAFKENELAASLAQLRDLETRFVDTLKQTANQSGGTLKAELDMLVAHMRNSGPHTGEQVREGLKQLARGAKVTGDTGRAALTETAATATERLAEAAGGMLEAVSEALKRQSDRMRP